MSRLTQSFDEIRETGLLELIGADENIAQNRWSAAVLVDLPGDQPVSGEFLHFTLYTTETGTGAVLTPVGSLFIFDADPTITANSATITAAERKTVIAEIPVAAAD